MNDERFDKMIGELLRRDDHYISDDGFANRVVAALPDRSTSTWRRWSIMTCSSLLAVFSTILFCPKGIMARFTDLFTTSTFAKTLFFVDHWGTFLLHDIGSLNRIALTSSAISSLTTIGMVGLALLGVAIMVKIER